MKRLVFASLLAIPILLTVGGIYVIGFTPDVVTQVVEYEHSHEAGLLLAMLGFLGFLIAGLFAVVELT